MNDRLRADLERYLAGGMRPEEAEPFLQSVRQDPEALLLLGRALENQAYLYDALRGRTDAESRPSTDTARLLITRRSRWSRRPQTGPTAGWLAGAIAAAAAILLIYSSSTTETRPRPPAPAPVVKIVDVPPPPAPTPAPVQPVTPTAPPPPAPPPSQVAMPVPAPAPPTPAPAVPEPAPLPRPEKPAAPTVALPPPEPPKKAIGRIEQAGAVVPLTSGHSLEGAALLRFTDGTKVESAPGTVLREVVEDASGKRLLLTNGSVTSDVVKQPTGKPLIFTTPHAVARVVGTAFRLTVDATSTKLEVREGKVQLRRTSDNKAVDVAAGAFAVVADGVELGARPSPIDEILLVPAQGEIGGSEWRAVPDPAASTGIALEALRTSNRQPHKQTADSARVSWVFRADANRDYYVWVRGFAPSKVDPIKHDAVVLEFTDAKATEREGPSKGLAGGPDRALFNGYMHGTGYWWVGGDADAKNDESPVVVRFSRSGPQTVKLIASEVPMRIDSILISATQKTRP